MKTSNTSAALMVGLFLVAADVGAVPANVPPFAVACVNKIFGQARIMDRARNKNCRRNELMYRNLYQVYDANGQSLGLVEPSQTNSYNADIYVATMRAVVPIVTQTGASITAAAFSQGDVPLMTTRQTIYESAGCQGSAYVQYFPVKSDARVALPDVIPFMGVIRKDPTNGRIVRFIGPPTVFSYRSYINEEWKSPGGWQDTGCNNTAAPANGTVLPMPEDVTSQVPFRLPVALPMQFR